MDPNLVHQLGAIFDTTPDVVFIKDLHGRYLLINPAGVEFFGRRAEDIVGHTDAELLTPEIAHYLAEADLLVIRTGIAHTFEEVVVATSSRVYSSAKYPYFGPDGAILGVIGISRDITERKRMEQAVRAQNEEFEKVDRIKSEFISAVSHELRTPLTSIVGYSEFLDEDIEGATLTVRQRQFVHQIQENARRLKRIVDDLLDFARLEAGTFSLSRREADLGVKIRQALEAVRPLAEDAGVTLRHVVPGGSLRIRMDPDRIEQVLINLVANAIVTAHPVFGMERGTSDGKGVPGCARAVRYA